MTKKRHKGDQKTFTELSYNEQAKSITAMLNNIGRAIERHIKSAGVADVPRTRLKCINQVSRLITRISK